MADHEIPFSDHLGRGCLQCGAAAVDAVFAITGSGAPPGHPEHDIAYDHRVLARCPSCDGLQLEIYRHDCFDHEAVHDQYEWFRLEGDRDRLLAFLRGCSNPLDRACECPRHAIMRQRTAHLQRRPWRMGGEHDKHVRTARVRMADGEPTLEEADGADQAGGSDGSDGSGATRRPTRSPAAALAWHRARWGVVLLVAALILIRVTRDRVDRQDREAAVESAGEVAAAVPLQRLRVVAPQGTPASAYADSVVRHFDGWQSVWYGEPLTHQLSQPLLMGAPAVAVVFRDGRVAAIRTAREPVPDDTIPAGEAAARLGLAPGHPLFRLGEGTAPPGELEGPR